jgi:hypothetical protein
LSAKDAGLTTEEIRAGRQRIEKARRPRALPVYSAEERQTLAILQAELARRQSAKGKASRTADVARVAYRRKHVNVLLRYVLDKKYREKPKSLGTVMKLIEWLDSIGIQASEPQVRRDIAAALESQPLPPPKKARTRA